MTKDHQVRNTPHSLHHSGIQRFILVFHDSLYMYTDVDYMYKLYIHIHYLLPVVEVRSRIIESLHEYKQFIQYNYYPRIQLISQRTCSPMSPDVLQQLPAFVTGHTDRGLPGQKLVQLRGSLLVQVLGVSLVELSLLTDPPHLISITD